jgi:GT2 family glycosyltransferase
MTDAVRCSIVIPVHDKAGLTKRCLDAIFAEPPRVSFEIVVVDDASTDSTRELLASYGDAVTVVRQDENAGFATSCNAGAQTARGSMLLFLNNDTIPVAGWLDLLVAFAAERPQAAVVGSKLLFPNETIQHAGVVICQDGNPRHIYAGFPRDHPAVEKSRRFQAVTAACALVRRDAFEQANGFDTTFRNGLEDVDLCLRLGELGYEVHYCHESVLYHLESVSRGRRSKQIQAGARLFRERWSGRVRADDLDYYIADGLLGIHYRDTFPLLLEISPELAVVDDKARTDERERLLEANARHLVELLQETVRLTTRIAELELRPEDAGRSSDTHEPLGGGEPKDGAGAATGGERASGLEQVLAHVEQIEVEIYELQSELAGLLRGGQGSPDDSAGGGGAFAASDQLGYRKLVARIRDAVEATLPEHSTVLVVSRGDQELLKLAGRRAGHFPQEPNGTYAGHYPADSASAIRHLEELRARGASYLLLPRTALWWLDHYPGLARHLDSHYAAVLRDPECCLAYDLTPIGGPGGKSG